MAGVPAGSGALVGKRLGSYEIVALLALGGTAEIYLARIGGTAGFEKYVVVKCLHDHLAEDQEFVQMFLDEARLGAQLDHSNIVQTLGLGEQDGRYYLVMEFIAGMSLALLARRAVERVAGGRIPVPLVLGIAAQACAGLHYAHNRDSGGKPLNLVHRDISPQNLVITFEGDVRIVDFGIAKAEDRQTATRSGTIKGKFAYMSPEQCHAKDIDRRTDVFALGVVVHELLTGRRLFKRATTYETYQAILECKVPPPSAVNHELDPALDAVLMKALAKGVNDRYPTAEAFGEALTRYLHSRGKFAGSADISTFIHQHFMPEVEDHGDRMRELLEGRVTAAGGWDDVDPHTGSSQSDVAEELSQFEVIDGPGAAAAADPDELPVDATRIEMNPIAAMAGLDVPRPPPPPTPTPTPRTPVPTFGSKGLGASIFGSGAAAEVRTVAAIPALPAATPGKSIFDSPTGSKLPSLGKSPVVPSSSAQVGRPSDKTAPTGLPSLPTSPRSRASTEPAPVPGKPGFGPSPNAAGLSTVIAEPVPRPAPASRGFAAPPEARTMMVQAVTDDEPAPPSPPRPPPRPSPAVRPESPRPIASRGLPASFEAVLSEETGERDALARGATVPAMDAVAPALLETHIPEDQPTYRAPFVDPMQPRIVITPLPFLTPTTPPSGPMGALGSPQFSGAPHGGQPFPSGELLLPPHGTPPGTAPSYDASLPAHLIGLPPSDAYPRYDGSYASPKLQRSLPGWFIPVAISVAAAVVIGIVAAVAS